MKLYFVYHISDSEDLDKGYIGVSNNVERRWKQHLKSIYTIGTNIKENNWTFEKNLRIIYEGSEKECFDLEIKLRPYPYIGLNESVGGKGGDKTSTLSPEKFKERNRKISESQKGRKPSQQTKERISRTKKQNKAYVGEKNIKAKKWIIISPNKEIFEVYGELGKFCKQHKLLISCLKYYEGTEVPVIKTNGYGGFREKSKNSLILRQNTTGWKLIDIKKV